MDSGDADAPPAMPFRVLRGVLLEVRPLPTAAAFFLVLLGTLWAGRSLWPPPPYLPWAMLAALFGMLTAHFSDSYTDVVKRGDRTPVDFPLLFRDSTGVLRDVEYRALLGCCVTASAAATVPVAVAGGPLPALLLLAALALAVGYARWLDRAFVGVTFGYPAGACTLFAASYLASGGPADARAALMASALFCALVGIKVRADVIDIDGDRAIGKRTVAVRIGERSAARAGYALATGGLSVAAVMPLLVAAPLALALPPALGILGFAGTARMRPLKASLWMSHAMLAALALEVAVLALA